jgi:hypothetical protein
MDLVFIMRVSGGLQQGLLRKDRPFVDTVMSLQRKDVLWVVGASTKVFPWVFCRDLTENEGPIWTSVG